MLAIAALRSIGVTNISTGAVAWPASAVIPATRVLRNISAECALIANLRRGGEFRALREQTETLLHQRRVHNFAERGHRADFDAFTICANAAKFFDTTEIHDNFRFLNAIFEPVKTIEATGHYPGVGSVLLQKFLRVDNRVRLEKIE